MSSDKEWKPMYKFNSIDMLLMDPMFTKSVLMSMYIYVDPEMMANNDPEIMAFLQQMFEEEAVEENDEWIIPNTSFDYATEFIQEAGTSLERIN